HLKVPPTLAHSPNRLRYFCQVTKSDHKAAFSPIFLGSPIQCEKCRLRVASAEDTILEKLVWYKRGGQVSDHQWSDVLGVATTRRLDREYLRGWAPKLGVADLLERLFGEAAQIQFE
ncbi:MAG TPA: hypothetical protein VHY84_11120, partial [Bryobacteraceae bacterium]|nr:hypothetical protein [Bryobacteraceae bacterium]